MLTPFEPAPEAYYQNNCQELFRYVLARYSDALGDGFAPVSSYLEASDDAQRLFARLLTRKGTLFRSDKLDYLEVADTALALDELSAAGLIELNPAVPGERLLRLLNKADLVALDDRLRARMRKDEMVLAILSDRTDAQVRDRLYARFSIVMIDSADVWSRCLRLYFGDAHQDWSSFVLRDLGQVTYEQVPLGCEPLTRSRFEVSNRYRELRSLSARVVDHPGLAQELIALLAESPADRHDLRRRDSALLSVARQLERWEDWSCALDAYERVNRHPARERRVRILKKLGRDEESVALLDQIRSAPVSEEEGQFALRFDRRNGGFQPQTIVETVTDLDRERSIESVALDLLREKHGIAWGAHVENALIRTLTGLLYWPAIFSPLDGAFTNPFQSAPNDLYAEDFATSRGAVIREIEETVAEDHALVAQLLATAREKRGIANDLVSWSLLEAIPMGLFLDAIPVDDVRRMTGFLIRNLDHKRSGLPDLFVAYEEGGYALIEVKGPGDQLQPGQRLWLQHFQRLSIPARVLRIRVAQGDI